MSRLQKQTPVLLIILLCFLTRLPQLLSNNLILDGDECVVALMAKHMMLGKGFPLFFYGQHYGLSIIECLFIIPFYWLLGVSTIAVKLGILCLWTAGVVFFYKSLFHLTNRQNMFPLLLTLVLIATPAWAVWSMKARGGYVTAFTFSSILLYLLFKENETKSSKWLAAGILTALVYESQALWLIAITPLAMYRLYSVKQLKPMLSMFTGAVCVIVLFFIYKQSLPNVYTPPVELPAIRNLFINFLRIPSFLYSSLHGCYFFFFIQKPPLFAGICAVCFSAVVLYLIANAAMQLFAKHRNGLFIVSVFAIVCLLLVTVLSVRMEARYLLPVTASTLFALAVLLRNNELKWHKRAMGVLCIIGFVSLIGFKDFVFTQVREISFSQMLDNVQAKNIHHSFCLDPQLCWEILFYSDEKIICRELNEPGRYPAYNQAVDSVFNNQGKIALIGYEGDYWGMDLQNVYNMNGYYICPDVPKETLQMHFRF